MIRSFVSRALFVLAIAALPVAAYAVGQVATFRTAQDAQTHCPKDTIVWLNLRSGVYHFQGQFYYGNTENGAYVCQVEATRAGNRGPWNER